MTLTVILSLRQIVCVVVAIKNNAYLWSARAVPWQWN